MRQILAYLLLTTIAFQLLPLKEVSAFIYGRQMVEEICNAPTDTDGKSTEGNEEIKKSDLFFHGIQLNFSLNVMAVGINTPYNQDYVSRLEDDIPTPPPLSVPELR
jgi:hypothetical protein